MTTTAGRRRLLAPVDLADPQASVALISIDGGMHPRWGAASIASGSRGGGDDRGGPTGTRCPFDTSGIERRADGIARYTGRPALVVQLLRDSVDRAPGRYGERREGPPGERAREHADRGADHGPLAAASETGPRHVEIFEEEGAQQLVDQCLIEGWSMTLVFDEVLPALRADGAFTDEHFQTIFVDNPRRWLTS